MWTFTYNSDYLLREIQAPTATETDLVYDDYQRLSKVVNGVGATDPNTSDSIETTWTLQSSLSDVLANSGNGSGAATSDDLDATYTTYSGYDSSYGQGGGSTRRLGLRLRRDGAEGPGAGAGRPTTRAGNWRPITTPCLTVVAVSP